MAVQPADRDVAPADATRPATFARYFPVEHRVELMLRIAGLILLILVGVIIKFHDSSVLEEQRNIQNETKDLLKTKSDAGMITALIPLLNCSKEDASGLA